MLHKYQKLSKYQIIKYLGTGNSGSVYLANDTSINQQVAIKILHKQNNYKELILASQIMTKLKHKNIIEILTVENNQNTFFIVMEYANGDSLDNLIATKKRIPPQQILDISIDICSAIAFAHNHLISHQDLRTANVILTNSKNVKVTDFNNNIFLKKTTHNYTNRANNMNENNNSTLFNYDVLSIGIIMYSMLTGVRIGTNYSLSTILQHLNYISPSLTNSNIILTSIIKIIKTLFAQDIKLSSKELFSILYDIKTSNTNQLKTQLVEFYEVKHY